MRELVAKDVFASLPERYQRRARGIAARVAEINALLVPSEKPDVRDAAIRLRGQFLPQPDTDPKTLADEYTLACADIPAWAISEAAGDFLAGRVDGHSGRYMPTCAEFAKRARAIMTPFLSERAALRIEAMHLARRAADDEARHRIALERQNPAVRQRVTALKEAVFGGDRERVSYRPLGLSAEKQAAIDALKKPREFHSKIDETRLLQQSSKRQAGG